MSIYITGDTHGHIDIGKLNSSNFPEGKDLTKDDYVIILGDFGLIWDVNESGKQEQYWLDWLNDKPWTTYVILGNHCNYDRLNKCKKVTDKYGNSLRKIHESIFWMENGIHHLDGKTFFTFGGGTSIDKNRRTEYVSWWRQEIPSNQEFDYALGTIDRNRCVDYVLTHSCPESVKEYLFDGFHYKLNIKCPVELFLDLIDDKLNYRKWFFGHYHIDKEVNRNMQSVYHDIIKL